MQPVNQPILYNPDHRDGALALWDRARGRDAPQPSLPKKLVPEEPFLSESLVLKEELRQAIEKIREAQAAVEKLAPEWRSHTDLQAARAEFNNVSEPMEFVRIHEVKPSDKSVPPRWKDRPLGRKTSPVQWILDYYGNCSGSRVTWNAQGLKRADLRQDPDLYRAYAKHIARAASDSLPFDERVQHKILDAEEALSHRRRLDALRAKRYRGTRHVTS